MNRFSSFYYDFMTKVNERADVYRLVEAIERMEVYKIIDIVGTSEKSFSDAAKNAILEAEKTVRKIRRAEVTKFDIKVENDKVSLYRAEVKISFEVERK